ncbi:hypothetical protein [Amnibacterium endophyticum]|uniref:ABC transporter permease n=1 Tax=Amnibacterium endophyticum TaxID=2109337 RepID=A0ABW4L8Z8_9MICO
MSTTVARPASPAAVVALQYANPSRMVSIPLAILVAAVVVTSGIVVALSAHGGDGALESNGAVVWSIVGFVVAIGVQAVAVTFPLALALGATRRTFTAGVLLTAVLESALLTAAALALLGLERVTGGWFVGARVLGDTTLGGGDALALVAVMSLLSLSALTAGAVFGAAWIRFGARGPLVLGLALSAAAVVALLVLAPAFGEAGRVFEPWWLAVAAGVVVAASTVGTAALLRGATVR